MRQIKMNSFFIIILWIKRNRTWNSRLLNNSFSKFYFLIQITIFLRIHIAATSTIYFFGLHVNNAKCRRNMNLVEITSKLFKNTRPIGIVWRFVWKKLTRIQRRRLSSSTNGDFFSTIDTNLIRTTLPFGPYLKKQYTGRFVRIERQSP